MQKTRRYILDILRNRGHSTVDEIVADLRGYDKEITAVTVRHHLVRLYQDGLIAAPEPLHRSCPGRPQYVYMLTEKAHQNFPNNYEPLTYHLLDELARSLPSSQVNVIFEGVADRMAEEASIPDVPMPDRLDAVVDYLNGHGYEAYWEPYEDGYMLHTANCPYRQAVGGAHTLCEMDVRMVASMLHVVPRVLHRVVDGASTCAYLIPC